MDRFHFSTVISNGYLYKVLAMYQSLKKYCNNFRLYILCIDQSAYDILYDLKLSYVVPIHLSNIEDRHLKKIKYTRTKGEYAWTLKPVMMHYVMKHFKDAKYFAHLDGDLYFYENIEKIFNENQEASLYLTDHNNSKRFLDTYNITGKYNTGFVGCKNDEIGYDAVNWWKDQCILWCYKDADQKNKRFGDQRYVEMWEEKFSNVHVIKTIGANVAIWNIDNYRVSSKEDKIYVEDEKMIFYHFSGLSIYNDQEFNLCWFEGLSDQVVKYIYIPYLKELSDMIQYIKKRYPKFESGWIKRGSVRDVHYFHL
ncbi:hypothetical protein [Anaerophilus nitritogenes]|uniref:hypothetical protein n=1 Tax=Anaerophilus nitritogenes TaxID=2498136 RepID=UPI00101C13F8|nr:hypothetical protein [Anaerophilus nitritogenes]